jgi:hypothetical protein
VRIIAQRDCAKFWEAGEAELQVRKKERSQELSLGMSRMAPTTARSKGYIPAALSTGRYQWLRPISKNLTVDVSLNVALQFRPSNSDTQLAQSPLAPCARPILSGQETAKRNPAGIDKRSATR